MKIKILLLTFLFLFVNHSANSQETKLGQVVGVIPFNNNCYSVINEVNSLNYYKTSPHEIGELSTGDLIELHFGAVNNNPDAIQVVGPDILSNLFCQIIETNDFDINQIPESNRDEPRVTDYVSYNSTYNVLVFKTWRDVGSLELLLEHQELNFTYNRGREDDIMKVIDAIRLNGWNMSPNTNGNKVSLPEFKQFLDECRPLSNSVLFALIDLDEEIGLNPNFMLDLFTSNLPFTFNLEEKIIESTIAPGIKNQIIDANDNYLDAPNYVYDDFLAEFPDYYSLYEKLNAEELLKLESGMDPSDPDFDRDPVVLPFERLITNAKHEIWIEGSLYKIYEDCRAIAMQATIDDAYQDIAVLNNDGGPNIPTIAEDDKGISMDVIDGIIPSGYIIYNPLEYDPIGGDNIDPYYNTALQEYNIVDGCPKSNFTFTLYTQTETSVNFYDMSSFDNALEPESSYIQYWNFGDGTGSFLDDPVHTYSDFGTYTVTLTTFDVDCGCWHVHKAVVDLLPPPLREGNPDCPIQHIDKYYENYQSYTVGNLQCQFVVTSGVPVTAGATVTNYIFNLSEVDGTPIDAVDNGTSNELLYTFSAEGEYILSVTLLWSDGCVSTSNDYLLTIIDANSSEPSCCDKKDKKKEADKFATYNEDSYKLKYSDIARGSWGTQSWRKIQATQKLYRKKKNKSFYKKQPAWHDVLAYGDYWYRVWVTGEGQVCDIDSQPHYKPKK